MEDRSSLRFKRALALTAFAIGLAWFLFNLGSLGPRLIGFLGVFSPFVLGFALAFVLNIPMSYLESRLFSGLKLGAGWKRLLSFILSLLILVTVLVLTVFIVLPELRTSLGDLSEKLPLLAARGEDFLKDQVANEDLAKILQGLGLKWLDVNSQLVNFIRERGAGWLSRSLNFAGSLVSGLVNGLVALVFAIYLLFQKEELSGQARDLVLAYGGEARAEKLFYLTRLTSRTFSNFLTGQVLEAIIIGLMFFLALLVLKFPYSLAISLIIGLTSLIPLVGSFIGLVFGFLMLSLVDIGLGLYFVLVFIVIQQLEGNLIYPRVVGQASGLPAIWVLVAVSLGGSLMGILGIILFIPIFSVVYSLVRQDVARRLKKM